MFSADSGVVWVVQCFAFLKFIMPSVSANLNFLQTLGDDST